MRSVKDPSNPSFAQVIHLNEQGFSNFFPGDPNFSIKILRDPKQKKMLTYQSYWEGELVKASQSFPRLGIIFDTHNTGPHFHEFYDNMFIHLNEQGFSNFFPGDPNFSIKILRDPKQKKMLTYQSYWEGELVKHHKVSRD